MRKVLFLGLLVALCGCSQVSGLLSFDSPDDDQPVATADTAPAPVAALVPDDSFCQHVAAQDATSGAFDEATQKRIALQSYTQCRTIFGGATSR
jgi:hypothetical protein